MDNWVPLLIAIFSLLSILFLLGVPVAFSFLFTNMVFAFIFWGGAAFSQMILGIYRSIAMFSLVPLPLFILMGEIIFLYEMALNMMDTLDKWIGRIPGRLSLMAVAGGVLFATLSGSSMASTAMLGQTLLPEMEKKGYKPQMTLGPIMGSGCLAGMMPLSALGIITATLAQISVGDFLITIIGPGLLMAVIYALYIIIRAVLQPDLAPRYDVEKVPLTTKIWLAIKYILPLTSIIIAIIAIITTGVATPSEAAAVGALICFILAFAYKGVRIDILKKALVVTLKVTVMMFIILSGATGFSEILAYTGATQNLVELVTHLNLPAHGHPDSDAARPHRSWYVPRISGYHDDHHPHLHAYHQDPGVRSLLVLRHLSDQYGACDDFTALRPGTLHYEGRCSPSHHDRCVQGEHTIQHPRCLCPCIGDGVPANRPLPAALDETLREEEAGMKKTGGGVR